MTDDAAPERTALQETWPLAVLLLCIFHFLANQWKCILETCKQQERKSMMALVYEVCTNFFFFMYFTLII